MTALACAMASAKVFHESAVYLDESGFLASIALMALSRSVLLTAGAGCETVMSMTADLPW